MSGVGGQPVFAGLLLELAVEGFSAAIEPTDDGADGFVAGVEELQCAALAGDADGFDLGGSNLLRCMADCLAGCVPDLVDVLFDAPVGCGGSVNRCRALGDDHALGVDREGFYVGCAEIEAEIHLYLAIICIQKSGDLLESGSCVAEAEGVVVWSAGFGVGGEPVANVAVFDL